MSNTFQLTFTLKQHTPIIHFQHEQEGATLRATEVKPKLDRFIVAKMGGKDKMDKSWFNNYEKGSLDYRISISTDGFCDFKLNQTEKIKTLDNTKVTIYETEGYPTFLSNMGGKEHKEDLKNFSLYESIIVKIICNQTNLLNSIKNNLCDFFLETNFGNRQSKGFGCFYPDSEIHGKEEWYKTPSTKYFFDVQFPETNDFYTPFDHIDLFYRSIRQGINNKKRLRDNENIAIQEAKNQDKYHKGPDGNHYKEVFYFKSLMFLYAKKHYQSIWEKKKIKKEFFPISSITKRDGSTMYLPYRLDEQKAARTTSDTLHFDTNTFHLFRDLLGFSTDESWKSYRSQIKKTQAKKNGREWQTMPEKERTFERFASPISFKPILMNDESGSQFYRVFVLLRQRGLDEALSINKDFIIENERGNFHITFPTSFDLLSFFNFFLDTANFDITTHVEAKFHSSKEYKQLENIFSQLRKNASSENN